MEALGFSLDFNAVKHLTLQIYRFFSFSQFKLLVSPVAMVSHSLIVPFIDCFLQNMPPQDTNETNQDRANNRTGKEQRKKEKSKTDKRGNNRKNRNKAFNTVNESTVQTEPHNKRNQQEIH